MKNKKFAKIKFYGEDEIIYFFKSWYVDNNNIAIVCYSKTNGYYEPYGSISTNLGRPLPENTIALDHNCHQNLVDFLYDNNLIKDTGMTIDSGFVTFPVVKLTDEFISKWLDDIEEVNR